jgi:hypothetical protein
MTKPAPFVVGASAADATNYLDRKWGPGMPDPFTRLLVTFVDGHNRVDVTSTQFPFQSWRSVPGGRLVHVEDDGQVPVSAAPGINTRPSPALMYRFLLSANSGLVEWSQAWDGLESRVLGVSELDELSEADQEAILEVESAMSARAGRTTYASFGVDVGTRARALEDRVWDEEGPLGLVRHPLPTPAGVPHVPGIPYIDEQGAAQPNPAAP